MRILLTGGGTGGHVAPILAVVSEIKKMAIEKGAKPPEFLLLSPDEYFKSEIERSGIKSGKIRAGKLRRYFDLKNITDIFNVLIGFVQAFFYVYRFRPDVVFSKGGFASVPVVIASWILRAPVLTHESDIMPGLANKINAFFAKKVLVSFSETERYFKKGKAVLTGNPVREDMSKGDPGRGKNAFKLDDQIPTILIFGGSQGAKKINDSIMEIVEELLSKYNVIHVTGRKNYESVKEEFTGKKIQNARRYKIYPFLNEEMKDAYAVSDLIVSRAGANSIAEIIEVERPSIIIPLSSAANRHQEKNAEWLSGNKMADVIKERELSGSKLLGEIANFFEKNVGKRTDMIDSLKNYKRNLKSEPARSIAQEIYNALNEV